MKKIVFVFVVLFLISGCSSASKKDTKTAKPSSENTEATEKSKEKESLNYQEKGVKNSEKYPASAGKMLYDKSDHKFGGMNYFFEGEIIGTANIENITSGDCWLVKNSEGYVMPIEYDYFEANEGDEIKVYGTLSGNGYSSSDLGVDNIVGVTGSMHAIEVEIN